MISLLSSSTIISDVIFHLELSPTELSVYSHIKHITKERGVCDVTMSFLMHRCGLSNTQLKKTIKLLAKPREDLAGRSLIRLVRKRGCYDERITDLIYINFLPDEENR